MALKRRLESEEGVAERVEVGLDLVLVIGIESDWSFSLLLSEFELSPVAERGFFSDSEFGEVSVKVASERRLVGGEVVVVDEG